MHKHQLKKIKEFCIPFYEKTGKFHAWDHIELVRNWAIKLAAEYPQTNVLALEAAAYIHDIGRSVKDEGHPEQSVKIVHSLLQELAIDTQEIAIIEEAVSHHDKAKIKSAVSIEAKLLFDADKLQIVTMNGFIRCWMWLVDERDMGLADSGTFLLNYIKDVNDNYLFSPLALSIAKTELPLIEKMVATFINWEKK